MTHVLLQLAEDDAASGRDMLVAMLLVTGIVLIAILLTTSVRGKIANRQADRLSAREQIEQIKSAGRKRSRETGPTAEDVEQVRHLAIMLDNKAERLEQLIAQADARIEAMQGSGNEEGGTRSDEGTQGQRDKVAADSSPSFHQSLGTTVPWPPRPSVPEPLDPLTRSVYELSDDGFSTVEIARKLDEQVGKVDLILALRQQ